MDEPGPHPPAEQVRSFLAFLLDVEDTIGGVVDTDLRYRWLQNCQFDLATTDVSGQTNDELFAPELAEPLEAIQHEALVTNARVEQVVTVADPDGTARYRVVAEPINADTPAEGVVFVALDESTQYRSLQRTTDAAYTIDRDWTITFWNDRVASRTGIDPREIIGRNFWDTFGTKISAPAEQQFRRAMDTGEPVEFEEYVPEPFDYWIEVRVFGDASGLLIHSRDITVRKRYERRLAEQRDAFETLNQLCVTTSATTCRLPLDILNCSRQILRTTPESTRKRSSAVLHTPLISRRQPGRWPGRSCGMKTSSTKFASIRCFSAN